jgi:hypothetical protein
MPSKTIYVKHESGAMHSLSGRKLGKLAREVAAGRGNPEICALLESGYVGFLAKSGEVCDFESITPDELA